MTAWGSLVAAVVLGTERRPVPEGLPQAVADVLGAEVAADASEQQVLTAAGVLGAWRRAGWTPPRGALPVPAPAPADERPEASPTAVQILSLLLDGHAVVTGHPTALVTEWLERCADAGRRPPAVLLPALLDVATSTPRARAAALRAGGPRLRWLAGRNPAWAWAGEQGADDPDAVWATGTRDARLAVLRALRRTEPDRARALLDETWSAEPAADRARFTEALATGLAPADEAFLEAALDDRSKAVRAGAAALLAGLPTSALAGRMRVRLEPLVSRAGRLRARLDVALPPDPDAAAARDGIGSTGAPPGTGHRAWVLVQLVGATPLRFWEEHVGAEPDEVVAVGASSDELLAGWTIAATRQRDAAWARALLRRRPNPALLAALPPAAAHAELEGLLDRVSDTALHALLAAVAAPWPPSTSAAVLRRLRAARKPHEVVLALPLLAAALDPTSAADVADWSEAVGRDDVRAAPLRTLAATISIRLATAQELA